jgi:hypothetical protein
MPWKVDRFNYIQNDLQTAAPNYATGVEAFDAAWDNCGIFIKNAVRQNGWGDSNSPTGEETLFKVIINNRTGDPIGLNLRYDYPTGTPPLNPEGTWETNDISWTIRFE